jgi:hypothetical protein
MLYNSLAPPAYLGQPILNKSLFSAPAATASMIPGPATLVSDASPVDPPSETTPAVPNALTALECSRLLEMSC